MPTIGLRSDHGSDEIPASHHDLVQCPPVAALTTVTPDGYPQTSVVWCDPDGVCVRVTLLCYDPRRPLRYLYGPSDRRCK